MRIELVQTLRVKNPRAALQLLDEAKEEQKKSLAYVTARNWILLDLKDYTAARQGLGVALAIGKTADVLYQDGCLRFEEKDYEGARKSLEEALKQNPEHMAALDLLAKSYAVQNNPTKALEVVEQYAAKRTVFSLSGWPDRKLADLCSSFAKPQSSLPGCDLGQSEVHPGAAFAGWGVEVSSGDTDGARRELKEVLDQEPGNVEAAMRLAQIEVGAGNRAGARDYYQRVGSD